MDDGDKRDSVNRPASHGESREIPVSRTMSETMAVRVNMEGVTSPKRFLYLNNLLIKAYVTNSRFMISGYSHNLKDET